MRGGARDGKELDEAARGMRAFHVGTLALPAVAYAEGILSYAPTFLTAAVAGVDVVHDAQTDHGYRFGQFRMPQVLLPCVYGQPSQ